MNYEELFVNPAGRTARGAYIGALLTLLAAFAFYWLWVPGRTGQFAMLVMLYPGLGLHARRLHDMGRSGWLVLVPGAPIAAAGLLHLFDPQSEAIRPAALAALGAAAAAILWCLAGTGKAAPAAA